MEKHFLLYKSSADLEQAHKMETRAYNDVSGF
jgi:hypothetical protein